MKKKKMFYISLAAMVLMPYAASKAEPGIVAHAETSQTTAAASEDDSKDAAYWQTDYGHGKTGKWEDIVGKMNKKIQDSTMVFSRNGDGGNNAVSMDAESPEYADGEVETAFRMKDGEGRAGVVFRAESDKQWVFVGYNADSWLIETPNGWKDDIEGPGLKADTTYLLKVRYEGPKITIWLDGKQIYSDSPIMTDGSPILTDAGHIGMRTWYDDKTIVYNYFKNGPVNSIPEMVPEIESVTPVSMFAKAGETPVLPQTVQTIYNTKDEKSAKVTWDAIDSEKLSEPGTVTVSGTVDGTDIKAAATITVVGEAEKEKGDVIGSKSLNVVLDPQFPRVIRYENPEDGNTIFNGQTEKISQVSVNGKNYEAAAVKEGGTASDKVKAGASAPDSEATYHVSVPDADLKFDAVFSVSDDGTFDMKIKDIKEGSKIINTISIPNQGLISVSSLDKGAAFSGAVMNTGTNANNGNTNGDTFQDLTTFSAEEEKAYMYGFLNKADAAASIWTNAYGDKDVDNSDSSRLHKKTQLTDQGYVTSLTSGAWTYRPFDADKSYTTGEIPEVKIKFNSDINDDSKVDWQDAAIGFRDIMNNPVGAEQVPELVNQRIPFNFASQATNPFLTTLDETKRVYNLTDGLGQMNLLKGYQNEGHDSAHPDYGSVGLRPGGAEDMNTLIDEGHKLNAIFGVHVNATESYPEAKSFNEDLVDAAAKGWDWLDPSYYINQREDAISGNRNARFDELKKNVPDLDYIYLDVWGNRGEAGWQSREIAKEVNDHGWILANEFPSAEEYSSVWNHWSAEKAYGGTSTKGFNSNIVRFIRNHQKDTWIAADNPLLGGAEFEAYEGWVGKIDFNSYQEKTFRINVPTKFLQHYQITNWDTATADDGQIYGTIKLAKDKEKVVVTQKDADTNRVITLDGTTVLDGDAYLLPWKVEGTDKLYHWNEDGGATTWTLTDSMKDKKNLHLYKLSDQGRTDEGAVEVKDGKVTLNAEAKTAYVVAAAKDEKAPEFGTDTPFKDPGFNAADTLKNDWTINTGDPKVTRDPNGDYVLEAGKKAADISQDLKEMKDGEYSLYVNTESHERKASVEIKVDDKTYTKSYDNSIVQNYIQADDNHTSDDYPEYMQKLRLDFTVPKDAKKVTVSLKADAGDTVTRFDDLRIVERETDVTGEKDDVVVSQDFEDTKAVGLYPFVKGQAGGVEDPRVHLSEKHDPYTQYGWNSNKVSDVLEGNWSLKAHKQGAGMMLQTTPQNLTFKPGVKYEVSFDYQTDAEKGQFYAGAADKEFVNSDEGIKAVDWADQGIESTAGDGKTKHFTMEVTGAESGDTTVGIFTQGGAYDLVIDNFEVVEKAAAVPVSDVKLGTAGIQVIKAGKTLNLAPAVAPDNAADKAVTYTFSKDGIVTVDDKGVLTAVKPGMVKVTAKAGDKTAVVTVRVTQ